MTKGLFHGDGNNGIARQRRGGGAPPWRWLWGALVLAWGVFGALPAPARDTVPAITGITLQSAPVAIQVALDGQAPFRVVRVDATDVMIAFKGVHLAEKVRKQSDGKADAFIDKVKIDPLPDDVMSIRVSTDRDVRDTQTQWDATARTLTVRLRFKALHPRIPHLVLRPEFEKPADLHQKLAAVSRAARVAASSKDASAPAPAQRAKSAPTPQRQPPQKPAAPTAESAVKGLKGGTDDLLLLMSQGPPCPDHPEIKEALRDCRNNNWQGGFDLLNGPVSDKVQGACAEKRLYLKAYACFRSNRLGQDAVYLDALNYFQDAMSYFPSSRYMPYAMASIGKIYTAMKNYAEAKGYFKIVLDTYKAYPGRPEVLFDIGNIYAKNHQLQPCIAIYRQFLTRYPDSPFALDVKLGLGKALYLTNQYATALSLLTEVLAKDPKKAFKSRQLLRVMGNCDYQLGKFKQAREALAKAYNLFPDAKENPITLTRIGDTYRDTGQPDKAEHLYQIVMDRYPGTDGFIISAMRRAALMKDDGKKETAYQKIIDAFPDHPVAKLAEVKLADLQYQSGDYRKSIETIRPLLMANAGKLASDAAYIMQSAFEGLLKKLMKAGAYSDIIGLKQKEWGMLRQLDKPALFQIIGQAYLKEHLYPEAITLLERAKALSNDGAPAALHYELGVALMEAGKVAPAIRELGLYIEKNPRGQHLVDAYCRMGRMMIGQRDFKNARIVLQSARERSTDASEKIRALRLIAALNRGNSRYDKAVRNLLQVRRLLAASSGKNPAALLETNRQIGEDYMRLKAYGKAVDAFRAAVSQEGNAPSPSLLMRLGEAYQAAGELEQAKKAYNRVLALDDDFWKYLAQERLQGMKVAALLRGEGV